MQAMDTDNSKNEIQVAILIEDIAQAKILSDGLREMGIFAHYYNALDEFWISLNTYTPELAIVDVKLMSQGNLLFRNHPKVKNEELKFCFFYKDSTKALANSTYGLNHFGLIRSDISVSDQIKPILRRINTELYLTEQNEIMSGRIERLKVHSQRLSEDQEKSHNTIKSFEQVKNLMQRFGNVKNKSDFLARSIYFFNEWEDCIKFGVYYINNTSQKLISPKANKPKYKVMPDLWLANECRNGISEYALEMAFDVSYGLIDEKVIGIKVSGGHENPDVIILARFNDSMVSHFDWELLELKLNSEYRRAMTIENSELATQTIDRDFYKVFQEMDDIQYHQVQTSSKFLHIDFSNLMNHIETNLENRFQWRSFSIDLNFEMAYLLGNQECLTSVAPGHFIVKLRKESIEVEYQKVQNYFSELELWRYFEDSTVMLSANIAPTMNFIAPSAVNTMKQMKDHFDQKMQYQRPTQSFAATQSLDI